MMAVSMASRAEPPRVRMDQPAARARWQPDLQASAASSGMSHAPPCTIRDGFIETRMAKGADESSRDGFEAGFLADAVERADGGIAGEVAAKDGDFVVNPDGEIVAVAPHEGGADRE